MICEYLVTVTLLLKNRRWQKLSITEQEINNTGFLGYMVSQWPSSKESICNAGHTRDTRLDPWVWTIPLKRKWQPTPLFLA